RNTAAPQQRDQGNGLQLHVPLQRSMRGKAEWRPRFCAGPCLSRRSRHGRALAQVQRWRGAQSGKKQMAAKDRSTGSCVKSRPTFRKGTRQFDLFNYLYNEVTDRMRDFLEPVRRARGNDDHVALGEVVRLAALDVCA